ncbi:MAG: four helix bundle protein [Candidatus Margulisbacteria bacterium]|nr:four helix bundle protein [Candidatus Margulisiibacteriota bacterium]
MTKTFEDFSVYKKGLGLIKEINCLCCSVKGGQYNFLKDQIRRASASILLNLAEGAGKWNKKDKLNFYRMSQASANECFAAVDLFIAFQLINPAYAQTIKDKLRSIIIDLQALKMNIERRKK